MEMEITLPPVSGEFVLWFVLKINAAYQLD